MRKLDSTVDLIELYKHHVGVREVPEDYDEWCAISIISAAVGNRVWYQKFGDSRLCPNLYIILMGPSANGKGTAIDDAMRYIQHAPMANHYRGKSTAPFMVDLISRVQTKGKGFEANSCIYLVTPELAYSVGSGHLADEFIKMMTELFTGGNYTFQHGTRTHGNKTFRGHCINWLGGSTEQWFIQALSKDDVEGGPVGRIIVIDRPYQNRRIPDPQRSDDYYELKRHIQARIYNLMSTAGEFRISDKAYELHQQWYMARPEPDIGSGLYPTWKRQDDLYFKLAMIFSLSSGRGDLVITSEDAVRTENFVEEALGTTLKLITLASTPKDTAGVHLVRNAIERAGTIQRQMLTRKMAKRGMLARQVQDYIQHLREEDSVEELVTSQATWYKWKGRKLK